MKEEKAQPKAKTAEDMKSGQGVFAVIRVRGSVDLKADVIRTLEQLRLDRANHCVLVPKEPSFAGMLEKAKHYITWGEASKDMLERLIAKRGGTPGGKKPDRKEARKMAEILVKKPAAGAKSMKPVFRLKPPSGGHKPIRKLYPRGALGYRGDKINELLKRMI